MTLMQKPRDVFGGLIIMTIGTGFLVYSQALDIGTASRMGPGYFPPGECELVYRPNDRRSSNSPVRSHGR